MDRSSAVDDDVAQPATHPPAPSRRRRAAVTAAAVLASAGLLVVTLAWLGAVRLPTTSVAPPPDSASREQVARTWARAVSAHDCDTADALWLRPSMQRWDWCHDERSVRIGSFGDRATRTGGTYATTAALDVTSYPFRGGQTLALHPWRARQFITFRRDAQGRWRLTSIFNGA